MRAVLGMNAALQAAERQSLARLYCRGVLSGRTRLHYVSIRPVPFAPRLGRTRYFSAAPAASSTVKPVDAAAAIKKEEEPKPLGFRDLVSRYGASIAVTYIGVWVTTGMGVYMGLNAFGPDAAMDVIKSTGLGNYVDLNKLDPKLGTAALALLLNELAEPVRLPLFLLCVRPLVNRYEARMRARGVDPAASGKSSLLGKLKEYGPFGLVYYTGVWAGTGVLTFGLISLFGPELAIDGLHAIGVDKYVDIAGLDPTVSNVAVAVLVNELIEPVRLPLALAALPASHRWYVRALKPQLLRLVGRT